MTPVTRAERRAAGRSAARDHVRYDSELASATRAERRQVVRELSAVQARVFFDPARFRVLIAGRRLGKTHEACVELGTAAIEKAGSLNWYVGPTYGMAKDIAWETLKRILPAEYVRKWNESSLTATLYNESRIQLKGAEHPDRLRGRALDFAVLDEFVMQKEKVWTEAIRPSLSDKLGRALFISTPAGFNWGHKLYTEALADQSGEWAAFQYTTLQGGRVPREEVIAARNLLDPRTFRQEYGASFEALSGRVYHRYRHAPWPIGHLDSSVMDHGGPLFVGMDFNVNPMTAVLAVPFIDPTAGLMMHVLDAISLPDSSTEEMAKLLRDRYPKRQIIVAPDPSGSARKTSAKSGVTDHSILRAFGFELSVDPSAPLVKDRVNAANALLETADGTRRVRIHPRAVHLTTALSGFTYKNGVPDPKSPHSHVTDAFSYLVWREFNMLLDKGGSGVSRFAR